MTRIYLGNLSPKLNEYSLIELCSPLGKIIKLDYLFYKFGPKLNQPKEFCFIQFETNQETNYAILYLNNRLVQGKRLVASLAIEQQSSSLSGGKSSHPHPHRSDTIKPTTISLIKGKGVTGASTNKKIAALEAKLRSRQQNKLITASTSTSTSTATTTTLAKGKRKRIDGDDTLQQESSGNSIGGDLPWAKKGGSKTVIDFAAAKLPARPLFDAAPS